MEPTRQCPDQCTIPDSGSKPLPTSGKRCLMIYAAYIMKRTQIYLEESQDERLARRAHAAGTTKSHLIREAIEAYLEGPRDEAPLLARFRQALGEVANAPVSLPDGRSYVERVRALEVDRREALERRGR